MEKLNLNKFHRGDTKKYKLTVVDQSNIPIDITDWTFWFTMKLNKSQADVDASLQKSFLMPVNADSTNGIGYITLDSTDTDDISPNKYHYDIQRVITGTPPDVATVFYGVVRVLEDVTINVA
jgi:hypothetical protein